MSSSSFCWRRACTTPGGGGGSTGNENPKCLKQLAQEKVEIMVLTGLVALEGLKVGSDMSNLCLTQIQGGELNIIKNNCSHSFPCSRFLVTFRLNDRNYPICSHHNN